MQIRVRPLFVLIPLLISIAASTSDAQGYTLSTDESQTISVSFSSGVTTEVHVSFFKGIEGKADSSSCYAYATVRLSSFPSARLAIRPSEIASAIRELANRWGATECAIFVSYENDTGDDLSDHERCVKASFKYDKGDFWSSSSESACWESA